MDRYPIELGELSSWIEGMRYLLADYTMEERSWRTYRDEDQVMGPGQNWAAFLLADPVSVTGRDDRDHYQCNRP